MLVFQLLTVVDNVYRRVWTRAPQQNVDSYLFPDDRTVEVSLCENETESLCYDILMRLLYKHLPIYRSKLNHCHL